MRRRGFLRRKINGKWLSEKESGQIGWCLGLFFILFLAVLLSTQLQLEQYRSTGLYLEDALAASNLASAIIDLEEYGISHRIRLSNPGQAYERCREAIKGNLNLNQNWECGNKSLIDGKVEVVNYIIFNVEQDRVFSYRVSEDGRISETEGVLGNVRAPNGILVEATGIYSEIAFMTRGIWGIQVRAHKGKLVDIQGEA
ncbi:MAG: hypothetical protein NC081_04245 [Roseburia sp.]|nr:hypothetical protein [Roseburia sp.]